MGNILIIQTLKNDYLCIKFELNLIKIILMQEID